MEDSEVQQEWVIDSLVKYKPVIAQAKALSRESESAFVNLYKVVQEIDDEYLGVERLRDGKLVRLKKCDIMPAGSPADKRRAGALKAEKLHAEDGVGQGWEGLRNIRYSVMQLAAFTHMAPKTVLERAREIGLKPTRCDMHGIFSARDSRILLARYAPPKGYCTTAQAQEVTGLPQKYINDAANKGKVSRLRYDTNKWFYSVADLVELRSSCIYEYSTRKKGKPNGSEK